MKLINEKSAYLFTAYLIIFTIVGLLFYFTVYTILNQDYTKKLRIRKEYVLKQLEESDSVLTYSKFSGHTLSFEEVDKAFNKEFFSDTTIYDDVEEKYRKFKQLKFYSSFYGKSYRITVRRSLIETEEIIEGLLSVALVVFIILLVTLLLVNKWISIRVWNPFYAILESIKKYEVGKFHRINLPPTNIKEFDELIRGINIMMDKISMDFKSLKEFTENISHEVQTPLSIIKAKFELLLQSENLNDKEIELVNSSYEAVNRLSKLTEALALLIRIENYQYSNAQIINLSVLFEKKYDSYKELMEMKDIEFTKSKTGEFNCSIDPALADILVENLVSNSIKHSKRGGEIMLELSASRICLLNSGEELKVEPEKLFQRFIKSNSKSLGLGLSIVKNICSVNKLEVNYNYKAPIHSICIRKLQ